MYLRFCTVVGYAGLWNALLILLAAKSISLITGLSIASISTNMKVKGGGAYFLISRSLGVEFGGVVAVFFYMAQAIAVTLYIMGFTEAMFSAFPELGLSPMLLSTLTNGLVFVSVYIGAGWTLRVQYGILAILVLSIISFFWGASLQISPEILQSNLAAGWSPEYSFFATFALFFPAVTGIMAGVNMSGDLENPSRAIPRGTFAAIGVSALIYAGITFFLAASVSRNDLLGNSFVMKDVAISPNLVYAGVIFATLSSALGSMMGAPRILQAFARDDVFRSLRWFGRGSGASGEPRRAVLLTFLIAQMGIFAGNLNTVAPVITMFFLMTYGTMNLACFYEGFSHNPSFRPTFRMNHWSISLVGAVGCIGVMLLINWIWAVTALVLAAGLYLLISRAEVRVKWGDVDSGVAYQRARKALLRMERERYHPKNWRPSILVLSGGAYNRLHLAEYACWLTARYGIVSIGQVIRGDFLALLERRREAESLLRKFIREEELPAFPVVVVEDNLHTAIQALLQCHGIGGMRPNTIMLGWSRDPDKTGIFSETLSLARRMKRSVIVVSCEQEQEKTEIPDGAINLWWTNDQGALMLLLAFMLKQNPEWSNHPLRILRPAAVKADTSNIEKTLLETLAGARIDAEIVVLPTDNPLEAVRQAMQPSAILFAGFEPSTPEDEGTPIAQLQEIVALPGDVILVYSSGDASLQA